LLKAGRGSWVPPSPSALLERPFTSGPFSNKAFVLPNSFFSEVLEILMNQAHFLQIIILHPSSLSPKAHMVGSTPLVPVHCTWPARALDFNAGLGGRVGEVRRGKGQAGEGTQSRRADRRLLMLWTALLGPLI
jgi:hypothetical protein